MKNCTICGNKIGFFRRIITNRLDKDPLHMIPLGQFCSNKCAGIGLNSVLKGIEVDALEKEGERNE